MSMMNGFPNGSSGGIKIKGIIERYLEMPNRNVSAGDFVKYINWSMSTDTQLTSVINSSLRIHAVLLPDDKILIAHGGGPTYQYLFAMVITVNGTTITMGSDTQLSLSTYSGNVISAISLGDNRVFISHAVGNNASLYAMVLTIDGMTITTGVDTQLNVEPYSGQSNNSILLPDNRIAVTHAFKAEVMLYITVVSVIGSSIIISASKQLSTASGSGNPTKALLLSSGKILIVHAYPPNYLLYAMVVTIDNTTITSGIDTQLGVTAMFAYTIYPVLLPNDQIFIAHNYGNQYALYSTLITVSGSTITLNRQQLLSSASDASIIVELVMLSSNKIFLLHSYGGSFYPYYMIITIENSQINSSADTQLSNVSQSARYSLATIFLLTNQILLIHNSTSGSNYMAGTFIQEGIDVARSGDVVRGVVKTKTADGYIEVFTPI